jgi:hypothetical protein
MKMKKIMIAMMAFPLLLQTSCNTSNNSEDTNASSSLEETPLIGKFCFEFKAKGYDKTIELSSIDGIHFEGSESSADYEIMSTSYSEFSGTLSSETNILTVSGVLEIEGYEEEFTQEYKIVRGDKLQLINNDNVFYAIACDDSGASTEASNTANDMPTIVFIVKDLKGNTLQGGTLGNNSETELIFSIDGKQIDSFYEFGVVEIAKDDNGNFGAYYSSDMSQVTINSEIINDKHIILSKTLFFDGENRTIWTRKYNKSRGSWELSKCEGECK